MIAAVWTQIRVIAALMLRETRMTSGSSHLGYLWAIIQPLVSISFLVFLFYLIGRQAPYGASLALFFATAILTLELYYKLSVSLMRAFTSNKQLLSYPMLRETEWTREGYYPHYRSDILVIGYPLSCAALLVMVGLFWERFSRKQRA